MTTIRRVLVAPSGFKGSLPAEDVAACIATGVRRTLPGVRVDEVPLVDGGEGSARALAAASGGRVVPVTVTGPVGAPVASHVALLGGGAEGTAVVEMAAAAGLSLVPDGQRDPGATTTWGVGELVLAALDVGATRILVGCGDSGTSDGGAGALQALGARVLEASGRSVAPGGAALAAAAELDLSGLDPRLAGVDLLVACNPTNVLTGPKGVARVFGPQKGASPEQVEVLAAALDRWADLLEGTCAPQLATLGLDVRTGPGTGASGGLGAGLAAALGARLLPRFDVMLDHVDLDALIATADLVITAEGAVDFQTPHGKVPAEVARRARRLGVPVIAFAGTLGEDATDVYDMGVDAIVSMIPAPMTLDDAVAGGHELLVASVERALRLLLLGAAIGA